MQEAMQRIIDKHMEAAFEEMQRTLGDTPKAVTLHIVNVVDDDNIHSSSFYQGCEVSMLDSRPGVAGSQHFNASYKGTE